MMSTSQGQMHMAAAQWKNRTLGLLLALTAGCTWLIAAIVMLEWLEPKDAWGTGLLCLSVLIFAPLYTAFVLDSIDAEGRLAAFLRVALWICQIVPVFLMPVPLAIGIPAGFAILMQGHLLMRSEDDARAIAAIVLGPLYTLFALEQTASIALLLLLPVSITLGIAALLCLHARISLHRIDNRRRGAAKANPSARAITGRLKLAFPLALLIALIGLPLFRGLDILTSPIAASGSRSQQVGQAGGEQKSDDPTANANGAASSNSLGRDDMEADLGFTGGAFPFGDAIVMQVRILDEGAGRPSRPLHLRDIVHDYFTGEKVELRTPRLPATYSDSDDGTQDGWTQVADLRPNAILRHLEISTHPAIIRNRGWTVLFSPQPPLAFSLPSVLYDQDSSCLSPREEPDPLNYEVVYEVLPTDASTLNPKTAQHPDSRYLQLPASDLALESIRQRANQVTEHCSSDYERVAAVLAHFSTEFEYALEDIGLPGTLAIAAFLEKRRGFCTYFASGAVMMLRSLGISSRVASGFMAYEWSAEEQALLVRERNAHAWMEVYFQDIGWITFDPTPARSREAAYQAREAGGDALATSWIAGLRKGLDDWASGVDGSGLDAIAQSLIEAPLAVMRSMPGSWFLAGAILLFALHLMRRSKRPAAIPQTRAKPQHAPSNLQAKLGNALARLGFRRPAGKTPREFAARVLQEAGPELQELPPVTERFYSARFGGQALDPQAKARTQRLIDTVEQLHAGAGEDSEGTLS